MLITNALVDMYLVGNLHMAEESPSMKHRSAVIVM